MHRLTAGVVALGLLAATLEDVKNAQARKITRVRVVRRTGLRKILCIKQKYNRIKVPLGPFVKADGIHSSDAISSFCSFSLQSFTRF